MDITTELVEKVIRQVVKEVSAEQECAENGRCEPKFKTVTDGIFDSMDAAIEAAAVAQRAYMNCTMAERKRFVAVIREVALKPENLEYMASACVDETGMGNAEHKVLKNKAVAELTPGTEDLITEAFSGDDGLTTVELSPYGVIGAICPTTNPTETIICNSIGMLAAGDSVVFSPHPRSKNVCLWLIRKINAALADACAPPNLIVSVADPTIATTQEMIDHEAIRMLVATGGMGIVKLVMQSGKKVIGAGAGNPPVVVDQTADLDRAARDIVNGCSFDHNLPCTAEKEVIAVDSIADLLCFQMKKHGACHLTNREDIKKLEALVLREDRSGPHPKWIGQSAADILRAIGIEPLPATKVIIIEATKDHPFVQHEMMMPVLGIVRADDVDQAIELAVELEHGNRHTAIMHSKDVTKLTKMGRMTQTTIFVKNGPSYAGLGIGGEGYCSFTVAGPTGEGLTSARDFARRRRCVLVGDLNVR